MENLQGLFVGVPPVTQVWTGLVMIEHGIVELGVLAPLRLVFSPERAMQEPWRLVTSFCYFGQLLISTLLAIWNSLKWVNTLEDSFSLSLAVFPDYIYNYNPVQMNQLNMAMNRLQPLDFSWFLVLICMSIVALVSFGHYIIGYSIPVLGTVFYEVLSYIACKINPNVQMGILGFITIPGPYVPYFMPVLEWLSQPHADVQIIRILTGDMKALMAIFTSIYAWKSFCGIFLGHSWWFIYQVLFNQMYIDHNPKRNRWTQKRAAYDPVRRWLSVVIMPPWYHIILYNITTGRFDGQH